MTSESEYDAFIAAIDPSIAGIDPAHIDWDLRWRIACSSEANAGDMIQEKTATDFYKAALDTAKMILDDWQSYYPELVRKAA